MDIKKLQKVVIDALEDVKAQEIKLYDTTELTSLFDRVCIASGTSNRQAKALASSVREKVKEKGGQVVSVEGEDTGEWVLVDLGDMVVHIMQPVIRNYYRLEELWGDKEVKVGTARRASSISSAPKKPRSSATTEEEKPKRATRSKTTSSTSTTRKTTAKKTTSKDKVTN